MARDQVVAGLCAEGVGPEGPSGWQGIPLPPERTRELLDVLVARAEVREPPDEQTAAVIRRLEERAAPALRLVPRVAGWRRLVTSASRRERAMEELRYVLDLHRWGTTAGVGIALAELATPRGEFDRARLTAADLADPRLGLAGAAPGAVGVVVLTPPEFGELPRALDDLAVALAEEEPLRARVVEAARRLREPLAVASLAALPIAELTQVTTERLRLDLLAGAGVATVGELRARRPADLTRINGIGPVTAQALADAAATLAHVVHAQTTVRLDPDRRTPATTDLVEALVVWEALRRTGGAAEQLAIAAALVPLRARLHDDLPHLLALLTGAAAQPAAAIAEVVRCAERVASTPTGAVPAGDPWAVFAARPADHYALLAEVGVLTGDQARSLGDLPAGLVDTVRAQELRTDHLSVTLRSYQAFAARFALVQRRVVIGDEMGLGKTIEALAVLAHLWATGAQRFLVVCPAAVVTNWVREVTARSTLPVHRLHGPRADAAFAAWTDSGGVAVTTYETLGWRDKDFDREVRHLDCVVVDEAHYIKNPEAWRTRATRAQIDRADRTLLLTGTPMENHVDEFRTLLGYLDPELARASQDLAPRSFRQHVAPIYLRRNVEDVLTELPELVETDEWLDLSEADLAAYRVAVEEGNFAAMRRAAMLQGTESTKVRRLVELVEEAEDNDRRVVVFSWFRDVLDVLAEVLGGPDGPEGDSPVFGPLTGDVAPDARQRAIDEFSAAETGAVLLAQITTGGVGLNIQAASVVVICEPQLKPTTEAQAIARAHRMGQLRSVQVHRLLGDDSVDERITEILAAKERSFDAYVRSSTTAGAAPEAREFADAELGRRVVELERARLLYEPTGVVVPDD